MTLLLRLGSSLGPSCSGIKRGISYSPEVRVGAVVIGWEWGKEHRERRLRRAWAMWDGQGGKSAGTAVGPQSLPASLRSTFSVPPSPGT